VCGKGNNGGDGFVVARLALVVGFAPRVVLVADPESIKGDAAVYMDVYRGWAGGYWSRKRKTRLHRLCETWRMRGPGRWIVGNRHHGRSPWAIRAAIEAWPHEYTVAIDLPSGLNADTGEVCGCCVRADVTVTFQFAKRGFENPAAHATLPAGSGGYWHPAGLRRRCGMEPYQERVYNPALGG